MDEFDQMLESVSRTFALSIKNLPHKLQKPVGLAYLLF
jgi:phytoene/squalene synthetase